MNFSSYLFTLFLIVFYGVSTCADIDNLFNRPDDRRIIQDPPADICGSKVCEKLGILRERLEALRESEKIKIRIAMFSLDETNILNSLKAIYNQALPLQKNVEIQIIVDADQLQKRSMTQKIHNLIERCNPRSFDQEFPLITVKVLGRPFRQGQAPYSNTSMHLKMMVIDVESPTHNNNDLYLITGSFNFTKAGRITNYENCLIIKDVNNESEQRVIRRTIREFDGLWDIAEPYGQSGQTTPPSLGSPLSSPHTQSSQRSMNRRSQNSRDRSSSVPLDQRYSQTHQRQEAQGPSPQQPNEASAFSPSSLSDEQLLAAAQQLSPNAEQPPYAPRNLRSPLRRRSSEASSLSPPRASRPPFDQQDPFAPQ